MTKMLQGFLLALLLLSPPAFADPLKWDLLERECAMTFRQGPQGEPLPVSAFQTDIVFDPSELGASHIGIRAGVTTAFLSPQVLAVPQIRESLQLGGRPGSTPDGEGTMAFSSSSIRREDDAHFVASGTLTLNGQTRETDIPFTVSLRKAGDGTPQITLVGAFSIDPNAFSGGKLQNLGASSLIFDFTFTATPTG